MEHKKVKMTELEKLTQPFYVEPGNNSFSKTTGRRTRSSRVSKAAAESSRRHGHLTGPRKKWAAAIEKFSERQPSYPRFLFRGIRPDSGGGNGSLNGELGVVPHAFINNEDYCLFNTPNLRQVVNAHCRGDKTGNSPFSSWTPSMTVAMAYSTEDGVVAMLDTERLAKEDEGKKEKYRVFHVPDLEKVDMAQKGYYGNEDYEYEYLVYGPVYKPAYRGATVQDLIGAGWPRDAFNHYREGGAWWPTGPADEESHHINARDIAAARAVAELYRGQSIFHREDDPAVTLTATTAFLSVLHSWRPELDKDEIKLLAEQIDADIKAWRDSGDEIPLVNPDQYTNGMPDAKLMLQMLVGIQEQQPEHREQTREEPRQTMKRKADEMDADDGSDPAHNPKRPRTEQSKKRKADEITGNGSDLEPDPKRQRTEPEQPDASDSQADQSSSNSSSSNSSSNNSSSNSSPNTSDYQASWISSNSSSSSSPNSSDYQADRSNSNSSNNSNRNSRSNSSPNTSDYQADQSSSNRSRNSENGNPDNNLQGLFDLINSQTSQSNSSRSWTSEENGNTDYTRLRAWLDRLNNSQAGQSNSNSSRSWTSEENGDTDFTRLRAWLDRLSNSQAGQSNSSSQAGQSNSSISRSWTSEEGDLDYTRLNAWLNGLNNSQANQSNSSRSRRLSRSWDSEENGNPDYTLINAWLERLNNNQGNR